MEPTGIDKRKLIKNSILLYGRMLLSLLINLYCSRVVLQTLGVVDYGVFGVVWGVVVLFTFFIGPLTASTTRFLTFEIGTQNKRKLNEVLTVSMLIHLGFALLVCLLTETIGMWFVLNVLVIPPERLQAAVWVLHFSVLNIFLSIMQAPLKADIIAHEKMDAYAVISIAEMILKLIMILLLVYVSFDKLISYAFLISVSTVFSFVSYGWYCYARFEEAQGKRFYDKGVAKDLLSFIGWMLTGGISSICNGQGVNMILNVFFGPAVNAARSISLQVQCALFNFSSNIQQALNPQITITYASQRLEDMHKLIVASSKFTFLFLFILSLPIFCYTPYVLTLWLGHYPPYTVEFVRMILVLNLIDAQTGALIIANHATGKVKTFQIWVESVTIMIFLLSYLYLRFVSSDDPVVVYYITLLISLVAQCVRIAIVLPNIRMPLSYYIRGVVLPLVKFSALMVVLCCVCMVFVSSVNLFLFIIISCVLIILGCMMAYFTALSDGEKHVVVDQCHHFFNRLSR